ncbi:hypothetical protein HHI36_022851 [Cryptolaemus montrouzieri]|uniref:Uncharacterized protein n=1 Tax=Cryptolaemus montrouzieri TaxID=559131 RepID=A0ABD2PEK5_9CUCU
MHHFPASKGDSLCPLGFHPQVRWPTRCKRCFRDYKEHYNRKKDDNNLRRDAVTSSSPSISNNFTSKSDYPRSWASSDNLYEGKLENELTEYKSTLDLVNLEDNASSVTTVNLRLPKRKSFSESGTGKEYDKTNNSTFEDSSPNKAGKDIRRIQIKEVKSISNGPTNNDVQFVIQVKKKHGKTDNENVLENNISHVEQSNSPDNEDKLARLKKELEETKGELEATKQKCDRLEKEKRDVILRRLPSMETSNKSNSEYNKLQQKCNELQKQIKEHGEEKSNLELKVKILQDEMRRYPKEKVSSSVEELRSKLKAAETLCEELMDENESLKKDVRDMEEQIDEMQDNFREDQVAEYTSLKAELEQTTKNCRILSFKLRKAEKRNELFEHEKQDLEKQLREISENQTNALSLEKIKRLEQELAESTSESTKLQTELGLLNKKLSELELSKVEIRGSKNTEVKKISRQSLIRSGSQEEPIIQAQVPDTSEIERDLREQLKFSEEEAENLRKTVSRIENDNEILLMQLKKLTSRIRNKPGIAKDIIDDEELKMQLELTEQEMSSGKHKNDLEKPIAKPQMSSKKLSEDRINKKSMEYEQQIKELKQNSEEEKLKNKQKQTELIKSMKKLENESKKLKTQMETLEQTNSTLNDTIKIMKSQLPSWRRKLQVVKFS